MSSALYVGLDAGGSKTELLARSSTGTEDLRLHGPGANPKRVGTETAVRVLADLVREAQHRYPEARLATVCAGVAGAGSEADQQQLATLLHRSLQAPGSCTIHVVHDAAIALEAAFGAGSGVILIAGTGSVAYARTPAGTLERTGGWGYLLGDEGGGYAIGREGLRAAAHAIDGGPSTRLRALLAGRHDLPSRQALLHHVYQTDWPLQETAALVLEAAGEGDAVASRIIDEQTASLADQVAWLAARCPTTTRRMALFGGLMNEALYVDVLRKALRHHLPDWSICRVAAAPSTGALQLALRLEEQPTPPAQNVQSG